MEINAGYTAVDGLLKIWTEKSIQSFEPILIDLNKGVKMVLPLQSFIPGS